MNASKARSLTTKSEYEVVRRASPTHIGKLSEKQLRAGVAQSRKLRDKFKTLADRQRREARGKAAPRTGKGPANNNQNTLSKIELFDQALERYQAKLNKLTKAVKARVAATPAKKAAKPTAKKAASKPARKAAQKRATTSTQDITSRVLAGAAGQGAGGDSVHAMNTSLQARSSDAIMGRRKNILAATPSARIRGHSIGAQARAQAKRDSQQARGRR